VDARSFEGVKAGVRCGRMRRTGSVVSVAFRFAIIQEKARFEAGWMQMWMWVFGGSCLLWVRSEEVVVVMILRRGTR
jgi:hypothetical protein